MPCCSGRCCSAPARRRPYVRRSRGRRPSRPTTSWRREKRHAFPSPRRSERGRSTRERSSSAPISQTPGTTSHSSILRRTVRSRRWSAPARCWAHSSNERVTRSDTPRSSITRERCSTRAPPTSRRSLRWIHSLACPRAGRPLARPCHLCRRRRRCQRVRTFRPTTANGAQAVELAHRGVGEPPPRAISRATPPAPTSAGASAPKGQRQQLPRTPSRAR